MRIFVTGASGFLGYHFVNEAVNQGHDVLCLRRASSKSMFSPIIEDKVTWVIDDGGLETAVYSFSPEVLFHAAWGGVRGDGRDDVNIQNENLVMSRRLFTLFPYRQIISIGSQAEYGFYSDIISEDYPLRPIMEYAKAKVRCCEELEAYCLSHDIEWQWIRIFTVFGENQTGGLIKLAIEKCFGDETDFDTTQGFQQYSYLYALDFAKAICNILGAEGKSGIFNLSQPLGLHSNREILEIIKNKTGSTIHLNYGAIPYVDGQIMLMDGKVDKFEQTFGKIPYSDFEQALERTIDSFR